ncbi:unnamed protein product [Prorocentrum cordatum]|uniref:Uncharacterized protein n=1 Tax=Prorocentrum cordatum TaxID=2364126 RepID=A0ABN9WEU5_9DINO|nr:unnamed protein product [Polarella glacialis]
MLGGARPAARRCERMRPMADSESDSKRRWAAASARTLARRRRRERRAEVVASRAQAPGRRVDVFRKTLGAHWAVGDAIGGHEASIMAAASAAKLLGLSELAAEAEELGIGANWARHAAPPALAKMRQTPSGIKASLLEEFRGQLRAPVASGCTEKALTVMRRPTGRKPTGRSRSRPGYCSRWTSCTWKDTAWPLWT